MTDREEAVRNSLNRINAYKKPLIFIFKIIIAAALIIYLVRLIKPDEILKALSNADVILILAAFILSFLNLYLQYLKWKLTCGKILHETSGKQIFSSLLYGLAAGAFTPARVGEFAGRATGFKDKSLVHITVATLIDKFYPMAIVTVLGSFGGIIFLRIYYHTGKFFTAFIFAAVIIFFYLIFFLFTNPKFWDSFFFNRLKESKSFSSYYERAQVLKNLDKIYSVKMSLLSFLFYLCYLVQFVLLISAFARSVEIVNYLWAGSLVMISKTIIPAVSFGDIGIREGASVFFLGKMGVTGAAAFDAAFFLFLINLALPALLSLLLLFKRNDD